MNNEFWIYNPNQLIKYYYLIIPTKSMNRIEQMNAVTRFLFYFLILCLLFDSKNEFILCIIIGIILIIVFYFIYKTDPIGIQNDLINNNTDQIEPYDKYQLSNKFLDEKSCKDCEDLLLNKPMINIYDQAKNQILKGTGKSNKNIIVESGYIDFDGNYKIGKDYSDINIDDYKKETKAKEKKKISWAKNELYKNKNSRKPTKENPFANIVFSDYLDASNIAEPCNIDDKDIQTEMQNLYNSSIYRNLDDVWERENSQRMFYTVPIQTSPNDQTDFANWLYKTGPTCNENTENCTYYESPQMQSSRY